MPPLYRLNLPAFFAWLLLCAIWSSTWIFIKLGLQDLPPLFFVGVRFVIASGVLALINAARRAPWPRAAADWRLIALTGFLTFTVNYGLLFWGEKQIASGLAAVVQATIPAFGLVFAHVYLPNERLTAPKIVGVLLGLVGVGIIFSDQLGIAGPLAMWGCVAVVAGAASAAYSSVLVKARGSHLDPAVLAAGQMTCGWVPLLLLGFALEGNPLRYHWTHQAVFCVFYLALLGSALAFCIMYWLTRRVKITSIMLISLVTPVAAVLIGSWWLHERLTTHTLLGGLCVLAGLGLVIFRRAPQTTTNAPEAGMLENAES